MTENPSHELATPEEWSRARHRETILRSLVTQSSLSETDTHWLDNTPQPQILKCPR